MSNTSTLEILKSELSELLVVAHVAEADTLEALGADSLDFVEICQVIEDKFETEIAEFEITLQTSVGALAAMVDNRPSK